MIITPELPPDEVSLFINYTASTSLFTCKLEVRALEFEADKGFVPLKSRSRDRDIRVSDKHRCEGTYLPLLSVGLVDA